MPTRHVVRIDCHGDAISILDKKFRPVVDGNRLTTTANDDTNEEDEVRNAKVASKTIMGTVFSHERKTTGATGRWRPPRREDFESALDYLEAKYVKCIMIAVNVNNNDMEKVVNHPSLIETRVSSHDPTKDKSCRSDTKKTMKRNDTKNAKKLSTDSSGKKSYSFASSIVKMKSIKKCTHHSGCTKKVQGPLPFCWKHGAKEAYCRIPKCHKRCIQYRLCVNHGGLVQLCERKGCINEVNWDRSVFCYLHGGECCNSDYGKEGVKIQLCTFRGCISESTDDNRGLCDRHSSNEKEQKIRSISKRKRQLSNEEDVAPKQAAPKQSKKLCSADGCANIIVNGGVCKRHGARVKLCSKDECTKQAQIGGLCLRHGAMRKTGGMCSKQPYRNNVHR